MNQPLAYQQVPLESEAGQAFASLLPDEGAARTTLLLDAYEPQQELSWCALASSCVILKALASMETTVSRSAVTAPTQQALFELVRTRCIAQHHGRQIRAGISLRELEALLSGVLCERVGGGHPGTRVRRVDAVADATTADAAQFASKFSADLASGAMLLINLRTPRGGGHWVPVGGAVRSGGDAWVLVLDPAAHKGLGPHWMLSEVLLAAMCTINGRGEARGYLAIESQQCRQQSWQQCQWHDHEGGVAAAPAEGDDGGPLRVPSAQPSTHDGDPSLLSPRLQMDP
jgi:hypothetical protein